MHMVLTYQFRTVYLSSVQKRTHDSHSFCIYMFSHNVDLKNNNRNYRKTRFTCARFVSSRSL